MLEADRSWQRVLSDPGGEGFYEHLGERSFGRDEFRFALLEAAAKGYRHEEWIVAEAQATLALLRKRAERFFGPHAFERALTSFTAPPSPGELVVRTREKAQLKERLEELENRDDEPPDLVDQLRGDLSRFLRDDLAFDDTDIEELRQQIRTKADRGHDG
jgi:hypothetical protein